MPEFLQITSHELEVAIVVSLILSFLGWAGKKSLKMLRGQTNASSSSTFISSGQFATLYSAENSSRATWALVLGIGSYFLWLIAFPLVFPAIGLSLWFGYHGRRAKNHFAATTGIYASLFHSLLIVIVLVLLIVSYQSRSVNPNPPLVSSYGYCYINNVPACTMGELAPANSPCICFGDTSRPGYVVR